MMKNPILITLALHLRTDLLPQQISRYNWPLFQINQIIKRNVYFVKPLNYMLKETKNILKDKF